VISAVTSMGEQVALLYDNLHSFRYMPKSGMTGFLVILLLIVRGVSKLISIMATLIYVPTNSVWKSFFLHFHQHLLLVVFLMVGILTEVRWNLNFFYLPSFMVRIWIFLIVHLSLILQVQIIILPISISKKIIIR
jgi:hypothetical protein